MVQQKPIRISGRFLVATATLVLLPVVLLSLRILTTDSMRYVFLYWNIILAAVTPVLAWLLVNRIRQFGWLQWRQLLLTGIWISLLPNSFYIITDFVHLRETYEATLLFDVVMLASFVLSGLALGYTGVYLVHNELVRRLSPKRSWELVGLLFILVGFAIYLGRFTRWNSWDILLRPAGLIFDVSDRVVNPAAHAETYQATMVLFATLFVLYWVIWEALQAVRQK